VWAADVLVCPYEMEMNLPNKQTEPYRGFEQGPIRPPSEANSLFIRVTRNCPWNKCTFCPVYKGTKFSIRPVEHVKRDIDMVHRHVEAIQQVMAPQGSDRETIKDAAADIDPHEYIAFQAAVQWVLNMGAKSVFLQDANSLIIKPADLAEILKHLKQCFPTVERITSYARAQTIAHRQDDELKAISDAGLNRIHVGLESGSDEVLKKVQKGVTKQLHIKAGLKVKKAGMELSEYYMPGLGGKAHSEKHALESADVLNRINPDFIRLRTLAIPHNAPLFEEYQAGHFDKCTDVEVAEEILLFIENLDGIASKIKSDHILNLFEDLEGSLPDDKERMITVLRTFLAMDPKRQVIYQVGRRLSVFSGINDMGNPRRRARAEAACRELGITEDNVDDVINKLMNRFV
jgi:histone acetyltransferase (RNA polymerase elongator complex component)